ncbi:MAG: terminase small subunit [Clostridium sp.]|uniref:terminase small subunit n=1 Tax=Clostridium sp. TaxID=1506 RepID=UPI003F343655
MKKREYVVEKVKEEAESTELTEKQRFFCNEYLIDLNATRAYKAVYRNIKNDEVASVNGNRMLRNAKVKKYLDKRIKEREKRTEITQDFVIRELYAIAKSNGSNYAKVVRKSYMKDIVDKEGNKTGKKEEVFYNDVELTLTDDLPEDKKKAIAAIKNTKFGIQVETCDKVRALELLGKHLGMFKDKVEVTGDINNPYKDLTKEELLIIAGEGSG